MGWEVRRDFACGGSLEKEARGWGAVAAAVRAVRASLLATGKDQHRVTSCCWVEGVALEEEAEEEEEEEEEEVVAEEAEVEEG